MLPPRVGLWRAWSGGFLVLGLQAGAFALAARGYVGVTGLALWAGHMSLLACVSLVLVLLPAGLGLSWRSSLRLRWPAAFVAALASLLLGLGYVYDMMCRSLWGDQGTVGLLWRFRGEFRHFVLVLGWRAWALPPLLLAWLAALMLAWDRVWLRPLDIPRRRAIVLALLAGSLVFGAAVRATRGDPFWSDDPSIGLLLPDEQLIPLTPPRIHEIYRDQQLRRKMGARVLARPPSAKGPRHVILFIVDAARPDHMGVYGYARANTPFLSSLRAAGQLVVVDQAYSNGPVSACGILGLLKSRPSGLLSPRLLGLGEAFGRRGWEVRVFTTGDDDWYGLNNAYGPWATQVVTGEGQSVYDISDDRVILDGLEKLPPAGRAPAFLFFHLMTVHEMGRVDPQFQVYQPSRPVAQFGLSYPLLERPALVNGYDGRILQADDALRRIFQALEAKGYLDRSVAVITADHGQMLGEHDAWGHAHGKLWEQGLRVPLLVWGRPLPKLGRRRGAFSLDVGPSLLKWAGLTVPETWEGRDLGQPEAPRLLEHEHVTTVFERGALTWLDGHGGLLRYQAKRQDGLLVERVFQVDQDPLEKLDLLNAVPAYKLSFFRREGRLRLDPGLGLPPP